MSTDVGIARERMKRRMNGTRAKTGYVFREPNKVVTKPSNRTLRHDRIKKSLDPSRGAPFKPSGAPTERVGHLSGTREPRGNQQDRGTDSSFRDTNRTSDGTGTRLAPPVIVQEIARGVTRPRHLTGLFPRRSNQFTMPREEMELIFQQFSAAGLLDENGELTEDAQDASARAGGVRDLSRELLGREAGGPSRSNGGFDPRLGSPGGGRTRVGRTGVIELPNAGDQQLKAKTGG